MVIPDNARGCHLCAEQKAKMTFGEIMALPRGPAGAFGLVGCKNCGGFGFTVPRPGEREMVVW